jgi:hypothetical protein
MRFNNFKKFLREAKEDDTFNAFVEDVFEGKWALAAKNFGNYTDKYHTRDTSNIYRIIFFKKEEIEQLTKSSDLKRKIQGVLTTENQGHPRFFTKDDYHNIKNHLSYLASLGEKIHGYTDESAEQYYMGIIISQKIGANDNVDFINYKNGNSEIQKRIEATKPVLSVNSTDFKIKASLEFDSDDGGWIIKEFTGLDNIKDEEDEEIEEIPDEETTEEEPEI